jgi:hypothetical protein
VFHSNTQRLIDHWSGLRTPGCAPARADFDPSAIANLLPQTFMLSRAAGLPFRLAGALIEDLHGRSLKGGNFMDLWSADSRAAIRDAVVSAMRGCEPVILYAEARTGSDRRAGLELFVAPLTGEGARIDRLVGLCQPISTLVRLHGDTVVELGHRLTIYAGSSEGGAPGSHLKLAAVDGRRIA